MKKLTASLMTLLLLAQIAPATTAKQKGDWTAVKALLKTSIAVKTRSGDTHFGLLQAVDDAGMEVQLAEDDDFIPQQISLRRDEVEKVWIARLRFGQKHVGRGALVGAGAGLGAAFLTAWALYEKGSSDAPAGVGVFPLYGAGAGAVVGKLFWKKGHKKQKLVYSM
jgi:hypothetical protein